MAYTLGNFKTTAEMRELVNGVLDSGRLSYGPLCRQFENEFAAIHGAGFGVLSNSGTSSLQVALQAMKELYGWQDGDEVIVPAVTFVATINIVYHCRLTPVLVDIEPAYYAIDPAKIEAAITPKTRCIIPVHPFGQPADMKAIRGIADTHGLKIIEDSCEAMFVEIGGKSVGSWGEIGCFSTYIAHLITGGVGGIATTSNPELNMLMRSLVNHGISLHELPNGDPYDHTFLARNFLFDRIGHSFRITELEAALLLPQLKTRHAMKFQREIRAELIWTALQPYWESIQIPNVREPGQHSWMVFPLVLRYAGATKEELMRYLRSNDIECRDMLPLTTQPCYDFNPYDYPVAQWINECGFYVGCHQDLTFSEIERFINVITDWLRQDRQ